MKVQDTLASIEQSSAQKEEEIFPRGIIDVTESDKDRLHDEIVELDANISKLETKTKNLKAQERKKATDYF